MDDGLLEPGNIDLYSRPLVKNPDGSTSTVRSMSFSDKNDPQHREILIPRVHPEGHMMSEDEAVDHYKATGEHLGIYANPDAANAAAEQLHKQQEMYYGLGGQLDGQ